MPGLAIAVSVLALCGGCSAVSQLQVRVAGNQLVDGTGRRLRLLGVNLSGPEYACVQRLGIFAGPADARAIAAMKTWRINVVRIPLNEQCWLGINGSPERYSGVRYRAAIRAYVRRLRKAGLYAIFDLHWNAPGHSQASGQEPMADLDHAPAFWESVARAFKGDPAVLFDLYNEPGAISWECWRDGCVLPQGWRAAGMQTLLDAVRRAGAHQPVIATGPGLGNDLSSWLRYRPRDPARQLVAGIHVYESNQCAAGPCWSESLEPVVRRVPVIAAELGQANCSHEFVDRFMNWADAAGVSYLGWAWNPFGCSSGPALISSWDGQATAYGVGLRDHLIRLATDKR
jgi:endoglucanase